MCVIGSLASSLNDVPNLDENTCSCSHQTPTSGMSLHIIQYKGPHPNVDWSLDIEFTNSSTHQFIPIHRHMISPMGWVHYKNNLVCMSLLWTPSAYQVLPAFPCSVPINLNNPLYLHLSLMNLPKNQNQNLSRLLFIHVELLTSY